MDVETQDHTGPAESDALDYKDPCKAGNMRHATCIFTGRGGCGILFVALIRPWRCVCFVLLCRLHGVVVCVCGFVLFSLAVYCMTA